MGALYSEIALSIYVLASGQYAVSCASHRGLPFRCCTLQTLPGDCGPFALAYAITLVLGGQKPCTIYDL